MDRKHKEYCGRKNSETRHSLVSELVFCADEMDLSRTTGAKYIPSHCMATVAPL